MASVAVASCLGTIYWTSGEASEETRQKLQDSLILVHGGMAQNVGPILEMVTEKYLLRSEAEWHGRQEARRIMDQVLAALQSGDVQADRCESPRRTLTGLSRRSSLGPATFTPRR